MKIVLVSVLMGAATSSVGAWIGRLSEASWPGWGIPAASGGTATLTMCVILVFVMGNGDG